MLFVAPIIFTPSIFHWYAGEEALVCVVSICVAGEHKVIGPDSTMDTSVIAVTLTTTLLDAEHPKLLVFVAVYVVVWAGLAVTVLPVMPLKPIGGDQVVVELKLKPKVIFARRLTPNTSKPEMTEHILGLLFDPVKTVLPLIIVDFTVALFAITPPPLLLLKQNSIKIFEMPSQIKGVVKVCVITKGGIWFIV